MNVFLQEQILKLDHKVICNKNNNKFRSISLLLAVHPQTLTRGAKLGSSLSRNAEQMAVWSNSKISIFFNTIQTSDFFQINFH